MKIAALYVERGGAYYGLPHVDPWDEARDARLYAGPWPVVAHPPCARWCNLAGLVQHRYPHLRKGEDGGCFAAALAAVRRFGGVLEHPAYSRAWEAHGLRWPVRGRWREADTQGGMTAHVEQANYGHRGRKATWLYAVGCDLPQLRWQKADAPQLWLSWCGNRNGHRGGIVQRMNKRERAATPIEFRDVLIAMAITAGRPLLQQRLGISADLEGGAHHVPEDGDVRHQCRDARGGQTGSPELVQVA